jgi:hypothetical protein
MTSLRYELIMFTMRYVSILGFMHRALWYDYATLTIETLTFQINTFIEFFNFWLFLRVSDLMGPSLGRQL